MTVLTVISGTDLRDGETSLAARFAAGESGAFEELVALYQPKVARLAQRLIGWDGDVEDIVQDVFLAAYTNASRFRGDAKLWTWLSTITVNTCRTRVRRRALFRRVKQWFKTDDTAPAADTNSLADERASAVRAAIAELPVHEREAVVLFYLDGRTRDELSQILGLSQNTVSVRLHRAREKLAVTLGSLMTEADHER